jgi:hypothetical protein
VTQQGESGAAIHLPLDHLRLDVHAFGPAVMKRQGDGGDDGLGVQVQVAVKACTCGRSLARTVSAQSLSRASLAGFGRSRVAKERMRAARLVISGQATVSPASSACWLPLKTPGQVFSALREATTTP